MNPDTPVPQEDRTMPDRIRARRLWIAMSAAAILVAGACARGDDAKPKEGAEPAKEEHEKGEGGKVIVITATTDEKGNYFTPSEIQAHPGDTLRFTLTVGVHNVHFLPDSNAGKTGLPAPSDMLQLPGQAIDIPMTFGKGTFYFQCDPHAALGMKGHVKVDD